MVNVDTAIVEHLSGALRRTVNPNESQKQSPVSARVEKKMRPQKKKRDYL